MDIKKNIFTKLREKGLQTTIKLLVHNVSFYFSKFIFSITKVLIAERNLQEPISEFQPKIKVSIRKIESNDLPLFKGKIKESKIELFKKRIAGNAFDGFIVFDEANTAAAFAWITNKDDHSPNTGVKITVGSGEAILLDDLTFTDFRGKSLQKFIISERLKHLQISNFQKAFVAYLFENEFSRRAYLRNGFFETITVYVVRLFGQNINIYKKIK